MNRERASGPTGPKAPKRSAARPASVIPLPKRQSQPRPALCDRHTRLYEVMLIAVDELVLECDVEPDADRRMAEADMALRCTELADDLVGARAPGQSGLGPDMYVCPDCSKVRRAPR